MQYALQVAEGVHELHTAAIPTVHRDIKLSNVLTTTSNPDGVVNLDENLLLKVGQNR